MGMTEEKTTQSNTTQLVLDDGRIEEIREFTSPEQLYQDLIDRVRKYHPSDDISLIEKAYNLAREAHQGQVRKSGEPYIIHPLCVAIILADLELDKETIVAGLLHDVVEDTVIWQKIPAIRRRRSWRCRRRTCARCFWRWPGTSV